MFMQDTYRRNNKGRVKTSLEKYVPLTLFVRFVCEREFETEQNCNILTPTLMAVSVVSFSFSRAAQPEAQEPSSLLDDGFLYCILSATSLDPNSIGGPFGLVWLFLSHLVSYFNSSRAPTLQGGPEIPFGQVWLSLPHLVYNSVRSLTVWLLSWLSYIIVQRPLNRLLNLWNGVFDRHQAEMTVMQFRRHSLPMHQSMSVSCNFFLVPFY